MKTLVITGGIGSGKTEVCSYIESKGIPVYYSDARAKALYDENPAIVLDIEEALGEKVTGPDGLLDKKKLASLVFSDSGKLDILESIVHPYIFEDFIRWRNDHFDVAPFLVMESAIILKKPLFRSLADRILFVDVPEEIRLARAMERDSATKEAILTRMRAQHFDLDMVDMVIQNDSDLASLYKKVDNVLQTIWE